MAVFRNFAIEATEPDPAAMRDIAGCGFVTVQLGAGPTTLALGSFDDETQADEAEHRARVILDDKPHFNLVDPISLIPGIAGGFSELDPRRGMSSEEPNEQRTPQEQQSPTTVADGGTATEKAVSSQQPAGQPVPAPPPWAESRENGLLGLMADKERAPAAAVLLGVTSDDIKHRRAVEGELLQHQSAIHATRQLFELARVDVAQSFAAMAKETVDHMKRWRDLSKVALILLIVALAFSAAMVALVISNLGKDDIDPWAGVALIFVLALFAISPAVLLLLQRPLAGLDAFSPSAAAKESPKDDPATSSTDQVDTSKKSTDRTKKSSG